MIDSSSLLIMIFVSVFVGFIVNLASTSVAKILGILGAFSFCIFLLSAYVSGAKIDNVLELSSWVSSFTMTFVPLILSYSAEATGAVLGIKLRRYLRN